MPRSMKPLCTECGDVFAIARHRAGYRLCLLCGEEAAKQQRASWCVIQEYGKGGYMFVTPDSAPRTLRETNQKQIRT